MRLTLEVHYLLGIAAGSARNNYEEAEWPPHPDRLFMALVCAYKECDFGTSERDALLWLEEQGPPAIRASAAIPRDVVKSYVPPNDVGVPDRVPRAGFSAEQIAKGLQVLPDRRQRKDRFFPAVIPYEPVVQVVWPEVDSTKLPEHHPALCRLAAAVSYLGHSASLVAVSVSDEVVEPTYVPAPDGELRLRVAASGRLEWLESEFQPTKPRRPPSAAQSYSYKAVSRQGSAIRQTCFDERLIVFRQVDGPSLPLNAALKLTSAVRDVLMDRCDQPPLEILSGHKFDGSRSQRPHLAIVPLAFVGHRYSDGRIMGFALVLPRGITVEERTHVFRAIQRPEQDEDQHLSQIKLGRTGVWDVERLATQFPQKSLQPDAYIGPATTWSTVTPLIFGHFPKSLWHEQAQRIVAISCEMIGLVPPLKVQVCEISPIAGVPPSFQFPSLSTGGKTVAATFDKGRYGPPRKDEQGRSARLRAHIILEFKEAVAGPVILGAGRYFGMGFCRPI